MKPQKNKTVAHNKQ